MVGGIAYRDEKMKRLLPLNDDWVWKYVLKVLVRVRTYTYFSNKVLHFNTYMYIVVANFQIPRSKIITYCEKKIVNFKIL